MGRAMSLALSVLAVVCVLVALPVLVGACINAVDRGEEVRLSRVGAGRMIKEYAVDLLSGPLFLFGVVDPGPSPTPGAAPGEPPVLLLPGYAMNRSCMFFLAFYLRQRGLPWVWATNNRGSALGIADHAAHLAGSVERLRRESGAAKVDLVCHSMGGLIANWYVSRLGGDAHVRRLITIGTPWRGTRMWIFGLRQQVRDLAPDSPVIAELQRLSVPTTTIWSRTDSLVVPFSSALMPGASAVEIDRAGHLGLLYDGRVYRAVRDALRAPDPAPPQPAAPQPAAPESAAPASVSEPARVEEHA